MDWWHYESVGRRFESSWARQNFKGLVPPFKAGLTPFFV
jgi:hypothetical protein